MLKGLIRGGKIPSIFIFQYNYRRHGKACLFTKYYWYTKGGELGGNKRNVSANV